MNDELKNKFSDVYSEHAKELIIDSSIERNVKNAVRFIRHDLPLNDKDFLPFIAEVNGGFMPSKEKQDRKTKANIFGVSFFKTIEDLKQYTDLVPSERNSSYTIVKVSILKCFGTVSEFDHIGHFNHFLFDIGNHDYCENYHVIESNSWSGKNE